MDSEWHIRRSMVEIGRRIYEKGFVAATDGNLSHRLSGDRLLVTASGSCLGELQPAELVVVEVGGRLLGGPRRPTSELALHLAVYRLRADVNAVVHAHPPVTNAFSFAGQTLDTCVIPEVVVSLGTVPTCEYATPSSEESPRVIQELIRDHDALILQRHGSLTVGRDLREAYFRLEKLEHAAHVTFLARMLGRVVPLSPEELRRLGQVCERLGWGSAERVLRVCGVVPAARQGGVSHG